MNTPCFYPMLTTSFGALYAASRIRGLNAFSTLPEARKKVRPAIYVTCDAEHVYFAPVTSHSKSLCREHWEIDLRYVPKLVRQSYLDTEELWCFEKVILHDFGKCISYSVDKTYVDSMILPLYRPLIAAPGQNSRAA